MLRRFFPLVVIASALIGPGVANAAPLPVPTMEIGRGNVFEPKVFAAPDGGQFVSWAGQAADIGLHLTERGDTGGPFGPKILLSSTGNTEPPSISFTPDGGLYAIWGISTTSAPAESKIRPSGGDFGPLEQLPGCHRYVDSAVGPGGIAAVCQYKLPTNPPDSVRWASRPTLGPVPVTAGEDLVPAAYSPFVSSLIGWGSDGTIAITTQGYNTTSNPPPANETMRIRVSIRGAAPFFTSDIALVTRPAEVGADRPLVLDDGTVAVPLSGSAGARFAIRPPGLITVFANTPLQGEGIWGAGLDSDQNIHAGAGVSGDRTYWSQVRPPGGTFGAPNPIPMPVIPGNGDAYLVGFKVAPDGTEYAVIRGDDGTYVSSRSPGQSSFTNAVKIGRASDGNPESAITRDGDLLVTWTHENGANDRSIELGGLDKTPPAVTVASFPERAEDGVAVSFSASATDAMGIQSLDWSFDGQVVEGGDVTRAFTPGNHKVSFTATDVAGQKTVVERTVVVPFGPNSDPVMKLKAPKKLKFRAFKKRGVRIVVTAQPPVRIRAVIGTWKRKARLRPMRTKLVRKFRNRHVIRIRPKPARLGKRRNLRLYVQVTGTTGAGKQVTKVKSVKVRR